MGRHDGPAEKNDGYPYFPYDIVDGLVDIWLVVEPTPLKNMSQLGWWHSQLNGKIKMFQTTNQKKNKNETWGWLQKMIQEMFNKFKDSTWIILSALKSICPKPRGFGSIHGQILVKKTPPNQMIVN